MGPFKFKQFQVFHNRSALKVGVDGVLIGAWACRIIREKEVSLRRGLDVGCGCGLIALMLAQSLPEIHIDALDIDHDSADEAALNFNASLWASRLKVIQSDICNFADKEINKEKYDLIVSNPPFFNSGLNDMKTSRELARHQGNLSPLNLIRMSRTLLKSGGLLFMIAPYSQKDEIISEIHGSDLVATRICEVRDSEKKNPKRIMIEFRKIEKISEDSNLIVPEKESITLRDSEGEYTDKYKKLTGEFYLNF